MLTTRNQNALHFLVALAAFPVGTVRSLKDIADEEQLPHAYLEQILLSLREAGIVIAKRGAYGGYRLAKSANEISVWDVIQATGHKHNQPNNWRLRSFFSGLNNSVENYLKQFTLADLSKKL